MLLVSLILTQALAAPPQGTPADLQFDNVALGESHGCGLLADTSVVCWGRNDRGQLGDGTFTDSRAPVPVAEVRNVVSLSAGAFHTCALRRDRSVVCWGDNQSGQLGAATLSAQPKPVLVKGLGPVLSLAAGDTHTCAVATDGSVSCWGNNLFGQLGISGLRAVGSPVPVPGLPPMTDVAAGYSHTCAMPSEGAPWCWGDATHGQLGRALPEDGAPQGPAPIDAELPPLRAVSARGWQTCAITAEGVSCWGAPPVDPTPRPAAEVKVRRKDLIALSMGWGHGCALTPAHEAVCWGDDRLGQLGGVGTNEVVHGAYGLHDVAWVAAGNGETCAARGQSGRTVCWGSYSALELDDARRQQPDMVAERPKPRRQLPPGTELTVAMEEVLAPTGAFVRVYVTTEAVQPCANTKLDVVLEHKGKVYRARLGDPFLPGGDCINSPGPAVAQIDIHPEDTQRFDLSLRWKKQEDIYQVYVRLNRLEIVPLQESFSLWTGDKVLNRVPPGSLALACTDHVEAAVCNRRISDGLPTCADVLRDARVTEAPSLDTSRPYGSSWFIGAPGATLISPDEGHEAYRTWVEDTLRDGSGCLDLRVRTWTGETWSNADPHPR